MNVWCDLVYGHLIGPYFYEQNLTAQAYFNFLRSQLLTLLQVLPNDVVQRIYFQQNDCPSHNARIVVISKFKIRKTLVEHLQTNSLATSIPRFVITRFFFLWGHLQSIVYAVSIQNMEYLKQ